MRRMVQKPRHTEQGASGAEKHLVAQSYEGAPGP